MSQTNYAVVQARIASLCRELQRPLPRLLAVTKGRAAADIAQLAALGQREFGENFLSELHAKADQLAHLAIDWVFIGVLQSNKIKHIVRLCCEIQTLASFKHARYVDRYASDFGKSPYPVYLAVNISAEPQKQGIAPAQVEYLAARIAAECQHLALQGIMAIPPAKYCDADYRTSLPLPYRRLQALKQNCGNGKLSLGMSADLRLALLAATDTVRIGRSLFV
ncbi:MAG: YggS family pyridoxal phosphate-dependent enzyme [Pseudomonadota bacterium]|nr:YggS family pyridoxal phosphate-dependent enzyme [Pseudomonadota bacterium]